MDEFKSEYASVNGQRLHYVSIGKGKMMLFLHGFPEFWYEWRHQLREFSSDYQAVALDMRGFNLSSKPKDVDQYKMEHLVEDIRAFADHMKQKKFILVGHDWGGVVAWAFAMKHPDMLEKLIIINAPHPMTFDRELRENPAQQRASSYMLFFRSPLAEATLSANNYAALVDAVLKGGLQAGTAKEEDKKAYIEAWSQPGALTGGLNYYRASQVGPPESGKEGGIPNLKEQMPDPVVKTQTLVIWGEQDTALLPSMLNGMEKFVPKMTLKKIPDGTHWVVHEKPKEVNKLIRDYLK